MRKPGKEAVASAADALSGHRIHRIELDRLHPRNANRFAVCGDSTAVRVFDVEDNSRFIQRYDLYSRVLSYSHTIDQYILYRVTHHVVSNLPLTLVAF